MKSAIENFRLNLVALCHARKLSQRALSSKTGNSYVTINRIMKANMKPSVAVCEGISKALGVPLVEMFAPERKFRQLHLTGLATTLKSGN